MSRIFGRLVWILLLLPIACNEATTLDPDPEQLDGERSIAYLKALATEQTTLITQTLVIRGTVTANDRYGELRQRLVIEDESGAIGIALHHAALYRTYPVGTGLSVHCTALMLCNYGGKVELGSGVEEGYTVGLDEVEALRHLVIEQQAAKWREPQRITIADLAPQWIDRYVRLDGVRFTEQGTWCERDPVSGDYLTTEHTIEDAAGSRLTVRTLGSVSYANEPLPEGDGSLYGVIDYFGGRYSLRVVNRGFDF